MIRRSATVLLASVAFAGVARAVAPVSATADSAAAPRFRDVRLATGVRLRYAEQGRPHGVAVILLHGYSDSWFRWSRVLPLIPPGFRVVAGNAAATSAQGVRTTFWHCRGLLGREDGPGFGPALHQKT